jgi:hypothetical protein
VATGIIEERPKWASEYNSDAIQYDIPAVVTAPIHATLATIVQPWKKYIAKFTVHRKASYANIRP